MEISYIFFFQITYPWYRVWYTGNPDPADKGWAITWLWYWTGVEHCTTPYLTRYLCFLSRNSGRSVNSRTLKTVISENSIKYRKWLALLLAYNTPYILWLITYSERSVQLLCAERDVWGIISLLWHFSCDQASLRTAQSVRLSVRLSVCLSVTPSSQCSCHRITMEFSGVITIDKMMSMQKV